VRGVGIGAEIVRDDGLYGSGKARVPGQHLYSQLSRPLISSDW